MEPRPTNKTTIKYILVTDSFPFELTFFPPKEFKNSVIEFLKHVPNDLFQLADSVKFYELQLTKLWNYGLDFSVFYTHNASRLLGFAELSQNISVVFLDYKSAEHLKIYNTLKQDQKIYFHFRNSEGANFDDPKIVLSSFDFIASLIENQIAIFTMLGYENPGTMSPSVDLQYKDFNPFLYFIPTRNNFFLLNKIFGNFLGGLLESEEDTQAKAQQEGADAGKNKHSFIRQNQYIQQIKNIDFLPLVAIQSGFLKSVTGIEPKVSPLIMVLPFNNPDIKKLFGNDSRIDLIQTEQTQNYIYETDGKHDIKMVLAGSHFVMERINYLDDVSFLHASLTFSPVIRLPIQGKSIYRELSFFRSLSFSTLNVAKNRKNLRRMITRFGSILSKNTLSPELQSLIKSRDGQIVAITDLPIEWLTIDNVPIIFTHDICRLPETSLHGLMSFYTFNNTIKFSITRQTISKTLVILGNDESAFKFWHERVYESAEKHGFIVKKCLSVSEVKECVHLYKPDILIFDCHGGVNEATKSTHLHIGNEILDGAYIVQNEISAPVVFISACGTAPTYGTYNIVGNAFFEAGSISVTSTYIPIAVDSGSFLYLRILEKLPFAIENTIHKNWLEFICHVIRTSTINETYLNVRKKYKLSVEDFVASNSRALQESLIFSKRRALYSDLDRHIQKLTADKKLHYSETVPEFLLYSNLGRGDLILFKDWEESYIAKNESPSAV